MKIVTQDRQCLFDIAVQYMGSAEGAYNLAQRLNCAITDELPIGTAIEIYADDVIDNGVAQCYALNAIAPATSVESTSTTKPEGREGIEYWAIEEDFVVS